VRYRNLVSPSVLAAHCNESDWVILDCRFDLADPKAGQRQWNQAHIPGAVYADLERDLSAPASAVSGRHPLPDPLDLAERLSNWGIGLDTQVVAYDGNNGAIAARAWWLLRWLGHEHAAILDGGITGWRRAGLPLTDKVSQRVAKHFEVQLHDEMVVDANQLTECLTRGDCVLDARTAQRFLGETEPIDAKAGHIPGAHNYPFAANLDRHGCFLPAEELRVYFDSAMQSTAPSNVICMCGSGVTACHNLLAMDIAGMHGARLYAGSWSEWSSDDQRPVATGPDATS